MMAEQGLSVEHSTICLWVQRYAKELDQRCRRYLKATNDSWKVDETYIKCQGKWCYLYRAVDSTGQTLDFMLSETRDAGAAKRFLLKILVLIPLHELPSPSQRSQFTEIPLERSERELACYYTFSSQDLELIRRHRREHNRLGFAVQLAYLRFPGRALGPGEEPPAHLLAFVAEQLGVNLSLIRNYLTGRDTTSREHLLKLQSQYGFYSFKAELHHQLADWLYPIALSTDKGVALVAALAEELRRRKILLPTISTLEALAWQVRQKAQQDLFKQLLTSLTPVQRLALDALLPVPTTPPEEPAPTAGDPNLTL